MRLRQLNVRVQTDDGPYGTNIDFPDGLVVVWADNSMGKSTCAKAILVALGMEATITTSQADLPLTPAVLSQLDSENGIHTVLESEVFLELENNRKERITIQRTIKGNRDNHLVTVHFGPALTAANTYRAEDFFVNRRGAAASELGFHRFLATFLDWDLPTVQTFDGNEYPLYLQCIFPYFMVEQTRGWATVQPPTPTHFRIRDVHKRAVEFLLGFDAHQIALRRQELTFQKNQVETAWTTITGRLEMLAESLMGVIQALPHKPLATWPPQISPAILLPENGNWILVEQRLNEQQQKLAVLVQQEIPRVQEVSSAAKQELTNAEHQLRNKEGILARLQESLSMERQELNTVQHRLGTLDEDIQRNKDVRTLRELGSGRLSIIEQGTCPVCHQALQDSLIPLSPEQAVMSLDDNIKFLEDQRRTFTMVHTNAERIAQARDRQVRALQTELSELRDQIRALRQTLNADGRLPSIAAIHERIKLETSIKRNHEGTQQFNKLLEEFGELAARWQTIQQELSTLPADDTSTSDREKITQWSALLREQLRQYGFCSLPIAPIAISPDTYRPEHEGFDLQTSISASDLIRTIWSYLYSMLELARTQHTNHPGLIIFDEPRQQGTRDVSFKELLQRAATATNAGQQVIFFTSENRERLTTQLHDIPHTFVPFDGRIIKKLSLPAE
jgi:hypothetical protein